MSVCVCLQDEGQQPETCVAAGAQGGAENPPAAGEVEGEAPPPVESAAGRRRLVLKVAGFRFHWRWVERTTANAMTSLAFSKVSGSRSLLDSKCIISRTQGGTQKVLCCRNVADVWRWSSCRGSVPAGTSCSSYLAFMIIYIFVPVWSIYLFLPHSQCSLQTRLVHLMFVISMKWFVTEVPNSGQTVINHCLFNTNRPPPSFLCQMFFLSWADTAFQPQIRKPADNMAK